MSTRDEMSSEPWLERAYLVSGIVVSHLREVFFKDLLIERSLAHLYDL